MEPVLAMQASLAQHAPATMVLVLLYVICAQGRPMRTALDVFEVLREMPPGSVNAPVGCGPARVVEKSTRLPVIIDVIRATALVTIIVQCV